MVYDLLSRFKDVLNIHIMGFMRMMMAVMDVATVIIVRLLFFIILITSFVLDLGVVSLSQSLLECLASFN